MKRTIVVLLGVLWGMVSTSGVAFASPASAMEVKPVVNAKGTPIEDDAYVLRVKYVGTQTSGSVPSVMGVTYVGSPTPTPNQTQLPQMVATLQAQNTEIAGEVGTLRALLQSVVATRTPIPAIVAFTATPSVNVANQPTPDLTKVPSSAQAAAGNASAASLDSKVTRCDTGSVSISTGVTVLAMPNVPQAVAATTMVPTPVGQNTPVPPMASGSGQQFCWPYGPRDASGRFSRSVSLTTPVTVGTAAANMFWDIGPSVIHNTSSTSVSFSIWSGGTLLWSDISDAGAYSYIPPLTHGGTGGQSYAVSIASPVTQVIWNGNYQINYR